MDLCSLLCMHEVYRHVVATNIASNDCLHPDIVGKPLSGPEERLATF